MLQLLTSEMFVQGGSQKMHKNFKKVHHHILLSSYSCIDLLRRNYQCDIAAYGPRLQNKLLSLLFNSSGLKFSPFFKIVRINVIENEYITHLYYMYLAIQAGFYGDVVECWIF